LRIKRRKGDFGVKGPGARTPKREVKIDYMLSLKQPTALRQQAHDSNHFFRGLPGIIVDAHLD